MGKSDAEEVFAFVFVVACDASKTSVGCVVVVVVVVAAAVAYKSGLSPLLFSTLEDFLFILSSLMGYVAAIAFSDEVTSIRLTIFGPFSSL